MAVVEQHTEHGDGTIARGGEILRTVVDTISAWSVSAHLRHWSTSHEPRI